MPHRLILLTLIVAAVSLGGYGFDRVTGLGFAGRSEVIARHGMAATSQPLATQAALDVLKAGGNAVDAAIAANAMLALTEPTGCGLGGDLFAMVWDPATGKLHGLNASGRSPKSLTLAELKAKGLTKMPSHGPLPVTVPGAVDGWYELHARFGKLPMEQVLAPAIRYAREGFPLSELIAYYWGRSVPLLGKYPGFEATYMPGGKAPRKGEIFKNPDLARSLELLAKEGRDAFYRGEIARAIEKAVVGQGGYLKVEDLAAHRSEWVEPIGSSYRGYEVWQLPPNTQGLATLQILNLLEGFDVAAMGFGSPEHVHAFVEAKKIAFEDRARWYADPAWAQLPVAGLASKEYAAKRRSEIDPRRAARRVDAGNPALDQGDTIYLTVADSERRMVSLIQSNYRGMGSGMAPPGLGFMLQNRGEMFSLVEGHANCYAPGKRPFQTIIPAFLTKDGKPVAAFGVMGGDMQPQGHVQIVVNLVDFGMNLQEAGDAPRIQHDGSTEPAGQATAMSDGGELDLESGFA
ncbi:MAG TPA: gamma-glutamyltransferase, partial [Thermoanaerobaculia bacterium]|nr:gamma-glutamyltransferase [Thermoanaerobaculia bacterium]